MDRTVGSRLRGTPASSAKSAVGGLPRASRSSRAARSHLARTGTDLIRGARVDATRTHVARRAAPARASRVRSASALPATSGLAGAVSSNFRRIGKLHTERLDQLSPLWVAAGWLVAAAATSLVALVLAALGLADTGPDGGAGAGEIVAVAIGFWIGGLFTGFRALRAPILHGIAIGVTSLVVWVVVNLFALVIPTLRWEGLTPLLTSALILVQMTTAVAGAWVGHRIALRGGAELRE